MGMFSEISRCKFQVRVYLAESNMVLLCNVIADTHGIWNRRNKDTTDH